MQSPEVKTEKRQFPEDSFLGGFRRIILGNKQAFAGFLIVGTMIAIAIVVAISNVLHVQITPFNPIQQNVGPVLVGPTMHNFFGTDEFGRDLFSRVLAAAPNDVGIGIAVVGSALLLGAFVGSLAAFRGGLADEALMRGTDITFALPALVLAMAIGITIGPSISHMTIALAIIWWPPYARLARGEALKVSHESYVEAARLSGFGTIRILIKHILPNILTTMIVYATLDVGTVILVYAGLSYLGLSVTPPQPDWGQMVSGYQDYLESAPWLPLLPGLFIALGVIGFSLLGDGIRDTIGST